VKRKLLIAFIEDEYVVDVMDAARAAGATGSTLIREARGEGLRARSGLFGLNFDACRSVLMLVVLAEHSDQIIKAMADAGNFDGSQRGGLVFQVDVERHVGLERQSQAISSEELSGSPSDGSTLDRGPLQ